MVYRSSHISVMVVYCVVYTSEDGWWGPLSLSLLFFLSSTRLPSLNALLKWCFFLGGLGALLVCRLLCAVRSSTYRATSSNVFLGVAVFSFLISLGRWEEEKHRHLDRIVLVLCIPLFLFSFLFRPNQKPETQLPLTESTLLFETTINQFPTLSFCFHPSSSWQHPF